MRKKSVKLVLLILTSVLIINITNNVKAASFSISASKSTVDLGDSFSVTINCSGLTGRFDLSSSSNAILDTTSTWVEGSSVTVTGTAKSVGTANITVTATNVSDQNGNEVTGSQTCTITVKEKESNTGNSGTTGGTTNNGGDTNNGGTISNNVDTTKEPTFTTVNQTVYATQDGINVRSSYSTSSSSIGKLKKGEEVTRIGVGSNGWSKVNYNGKTAYISSSLLTTTKPEEEKSTVKALKSLTVEPGTLSPEFDPETTKYTMTVGTDVTKLNIKAVVEDEKSKLDISGNEDLKLGENIIKLVVTAEDETARTYTITVTKEEQEQLKLEALSIKGINLNPSFSSDIYEYTAEIDDDITKLDIEALSNTENATVEILGNEDLQEGENTITIMLKSEDGKQNVTYQIIVKKGEKTLVNKNVSEEDNSNMQYIIVGSVLGGVLLIIIIVLIVKKIRNNRDDDGIELNFMDDIKMMDNDDNILENNNQDEEAKQEEYIEMEQQNKTKTNKLYNVEDEVDFGNDLKESKRRKGKHF